MGLTLEKWVSFQNEKQKEFVLSCFDRNSAVEIFLKFGMKHPIRVINFSGNSFETRNGERVTIDEKHQRVWVTIDGEEKTYAIEGNGTDIVLLRK